MRKTAKERLAERDARARSELFDTLFDAWIGGANNAALVERLGAIDARDRAAVAGALCSDIEPRFAELTRETQGRIRTAISIIAAARGEEFRVYWLELPPPFGASEAEADAVFPVLAKALGVRLPDTHSGG